MTVQPLPNGPIDPQETTEGEKFDLRGLLRIYWAFGRYYKKYWKVLTLSYLCLFATIGVTALKPWPIKLILDRVILGKHLPHRFAFLNPGTPDDRTILLLVLAVSIVLISLLEALFSYVDKYLVGATGDRISADVRERVFAHLQRLSLSFHETAHSGNLVYLLVSDTRQLTKLLIDFPRDLTMRMVTFALCAGLMLALDWRLGLIALAAVPLIYLCTSYFGAGMKQASRTVREREGQVASIAGENVAGIAVVQAYGQEENERQRFEAGNQESLDAQLRAVRLHRTYGRFVDFLVTMSTAGVLFYGGRWALGGDLLPGTLVVFMAYIKELYGSFDRFSGLFMNLARSRACAERILELIENEMVVADAPDAVPAPPLHGRVEFKNVSFAYRGGPPVLKNLSFVAEPGQTVAVVGHSGAGKSTLISLLLRFYDPQEGTIWVDGHDVRSLTRRSLREQTTVVLQDAQLFRQSVAENIGFGRKGASADEIAEAAKLAGADEFIARMPHGYETVLAEGGDDLSGGERQRIHIARAMLRRTPIVILDEPVSGLDTVAEAKIQAAVRRLTEHRTTFIVAHKMSTLAHADRILVLDNGTIAEQGTHEQLIRESRAYREFCELQIGRQLPAASSKGAGVREHKTQTTALPGGSQ